MDDKAKIIAVELRIKVDWRDSRITFNNSGPAVSESVMRSRNYLATCLWYPMVDIFNFVSAEDNTMMPEWQRVLLKQSPNNDDGVSIFHFN